MDVQDHSHNRASVRSSSIAIPRAEILAHASLFDVFLGITLAGWHAMQTT